MTTDALHTIAQALGLLHDDAYNPVRAAATEPVERNRWTEDALNRHEHATTHPHLRRATGAKAATMPTGDHHARTTYLHAANVITTAYDLLIPPAARQRPRGPVDGPARPGDLTGMLAAIHHTLTRWDDQGQRAHDLGPVRDDQVRHLHQLAATLTAWTTTWTPEANHPICPNPRHRRQCTGTIIVNGLCKSCDNRERYLRTTLGEHYQPPPDPNTVATHDRWRADHGQANPTRVVSEPRTGGPAAPTTPQAPPTATRTTTCRTCTRGVTIPVDTDPHMARCTGCDDADAA